MTTMMFPPPLEDEPPPQERFLQVASSSSKQDELKCGQPMRRSLDMRSQSQQPCLETASSHDEENNDCQRSYVLYIPSVACHQDKDIGILPLVFGIHCYGCTTSTLMHWTNVAENFHFVLVLPEGLQQSFNADQKCCGYAMKNKVNDVGLLQAIQYQLDHNTSFLSSVVDSSRASYAMGWSNGGYLVSAAHAFFHAIAPVSGYQVELQHAARPTAIMLHHAVDDPFVRPTGCCPNASMPACCCGLSAAQTTCTTVQDKMHEWSVRNECNNDDDDSDDNESMITLQNANVTCTTRRHCKANTTFCLHGSGGHFNRPSFQASFPHTTEIAHFFAQHACETVGRSGTWLRHEQTCDCPAHTSAGLFCIESSSHHEDDKELLFQNIDDYSYELPTGRIFFVVTLLIVLILWRKRRKNLGVTMMFDLEMVSKRNETE